MDGSRWHASRLRRVMAPPASDQAAADGLRHTDGERDALDAVPGTPLSGIPL